MDEQKIKKAIKMIIEAIGENPERLGLRATPERVAKMYKEILAGINQKPKFVICEVNNQDEMILVKDIVFYSICEHHLLPFFGNVHIAYIPNKNKISGVSKLVRVVECIARRLQLQERLTIEIAETIMEGLKPQGVLVIVEAEHMCMTMRGVKKPGSKMLTSAMRGIFRKEPTRLEALSLLKGR